MMLGIATFQGFVFLVLSLLVFLLAAYALIDAARQKTAAFPAAGKLTKPIWLAILGVATAVGFVSLPVAGVSLLHPLGFLNIIGAVAAGVYLADVRPAVSRYRDRGGSSGPYGSW